jgi:hypothetical protein
MNGNDQIALVFAGKAKHPHRSIMRAIRRIERWEAEGWLYMRRHVTRPDVEKLLPEGVRRQLEAMPLRTQADLDQRYAFRRKHRAAYDAALAHWRVQELQRWAIVFDFAVQAGYGLSRKQQALWLRIFAQLHG